MTKKVQKYQKYLDQGLTARGDERKIRLHREMPFPELPANHDKNSIRKRMPVNLLPDVIKQVTEQAKTEGRSRGRCVEDAVIKYCNEKEKTISGAKEIFFENPLEKIFVAVVKLPVEQQNLLLGKIVKYHASLKPK